MPHEHAILATQIGASEEFYVVSREEAEASVSKRSGDFSSADEFKGEEGGFLRPADNAVKIY